MAINSVGAAANAAQQLSANQVRQPEQGREAVQSRQTEQVEQRREDENNQEPRPVVNAQGQVTGKIVNITA